VDRAQVPAGPLPTTAAARQVRVLLGGDRARGAPGPARGQVPRLVRAAARRRRRGHRHDRRLRQRRPPLLPRPGHRPRLRRSRRPDWRRRICACAPRGHSHRRFEQMFQHIDHAPR